jgi:hypothetical protein
MANDPVEAWRDYVTALNDFYAPISAAAPKDPNELLAASDKLTEETTPYLGPGIDPSQRQLAELKLLAGAVMDLAVANDSVEPAVGPIEGAEVRDRRGAAFAMILKDYLDPILSTPIEKGIEAVLPGAAESQGEARPNSPKEAKEDLVKAINEACRDIVDAAAGVGQTAFTGVILLAPNPLELLGSIMGKGFQQFLNGLKEALDELARPMTDLAAQFFLKASRKILALLGKDDKEGDTVLKKLKEQLSQLLEQLSIKVLIRTLYQPQEIENEVQTLLNNARDAAAINLAASKVKDLAPAFEKKAKLATIALMLLTSVQKGLMTLQPYGPIAVAATYVGVVAFAVLSGGDYIDTWKKPDYVSGVRHLVKEAVKDGN